MTSTPKPYDLLWPVGRRREIQRSGGKGTTGKVDELNPPNGEHFEFLIFFFHFLSLRGFGRA